MGADEDGGLISGFDLFLSGDKLKIFGEERKLFKGKSVLLCQNLSWS